MPKWEYKRKHIMNWLGGDEEDDLNELGGNEWEIFHIDQMGNSERDKVAYCKRPIKKTKKKDNPKELVEKLLERLINNG